MNETNIFLYKMLGLIGITWAAMGWFLYRYYNPIRRYNGKLFHLCHKHTKDLKKGQLALVVPQDKCVCCYYLKHLS